ncbi:hypothetical protein [Amycolatopsis sp. WGS_07]|uniref:hypothetical protein n=1 Tax=Amycolatopsis sp. WGS_07 TaxID=3076764 RepID=UPI0038731DEA
MFWRLYSVRGGPPNRFSLCSTLWYSSTVPFVFPAWKPFSFCRMCPISWKIVRSGTFSPSAMMLPSRR